MKKVKLLVFAAMLALCSGCVINKAAVSPKPAPIAPAPAPVVAETQADANFSVASEISTKLRVVFDGPASERVFCSKLAERLANSVVLDKAELILNGKGDVRILLKPEFELRDKAGNYYRINCTQITASVLSRQKVYALKTIEPKPMPRKLGLQSAKDQYLPFAVKAITPFLKKELTRISNEQISVSIVNFTLANSQNYPDSRFVAERVNKIAQVLNNMPGVLNYVNIRQDVSRASCSFRIVYLRDQFPQGITNVLNLNLSGK